ncbi:MAG TPA: fumarate hydratase C-terminal domain-containing protein [Alphaproteobacteria bacterium]|nr:fumarate hydratase C-terminal domain-containing protein [Alphaproteobacteria bacterium]
MATGTRKEVRLKTPVTADELEPLELGDVVYLDGHVYTAREGVYKRVLDEGHSLPEGLTALTNVSFHCSPAASVNDDGTFNIGAVTATASFRFGKWMPKWFDVSKCRLILGKGGMTEEDYREVFLPNGARYLTTVGYGTGALLGRGIREVEAVHWLEDLGIAQAIWVLRIEKFGPFLVESDGEGRSLFEQHNKRLNQRIEGLYEGLKPPALSRYGESDDRRDELI